MSLSPFRAYSVPQSPLTLLGGALAFLSMTGCQLHTVERAPVPEAVPTAYQHGVENGRVAGATWWQGFADPQLGQWIERGLAKSYTLDAVRARWRQAEMVRQRAGGALGPTLKGVVGWDHDLIAEEKREDAWESGVELTWELDFFKRLQATRLARAAEAESRRQAWQTARLALSVQIAEAYWAVIEQTRLLDLLRSQQEASEEFLAIVGQRFEQGLISKVDWLQQRGQLLEITSLVPEAEATLAVQRKILHTLVGGEPTEPAFGFARQLPLVGGWPELGSPSELLWRRPDLVGARMDLVAGDAEVARALAERWPRLTIAADGLQIDGRGRSGFLSTLGPSLEVPLWNGGAVKAEIERTRALKQERWALYQQVFLEALQEVENGVEREIQQRRLLSILEERRTILTETVAQAKERYTLGVSDYLSVLTSLQQLNAVEQRLIREQRRLVSFRTALHRALGGPLSFGDDPKEKGLVAEAASP